MSAGIDTCFLIQTGRLHLPVTFERFIMFVKFFSAKKVKSIQDGLDFSGLRAMFLARFIENPQMNGLFFEFCSFSQNVIWKGWET